MGRKKKIGILNLESAIQEILKEYGDDVYEVLKDSVEDVSDKGVEKLQAVRRFAKDGHPTGVYSQNWGTEDVPTTRLKTKKVIRNEDHYRLTHLLEKGHATRNGTSRVFPRTPAYPHIKPVEEWAIKELPIEVERRLNKL